MPTNKQLTDLIINKVESQEVYDYMAAHGLINDDELYLVEGEGAPTAFWITPGVTTIGELVEAYVKNYPCYVAIQDGEYTRVLKAVSHNYIESTSVHNFTFNAIEGQDGIIYYWPTFGTTDMVIPERTVVKRPIELEEEIYFINYGATSYADVASAVNAGKVVACKATLSDQSVIYFMLHNKNAQGDFYFSAQPNYYQVYHFTLAADGTYGSLYAAGYVTDVTAGNGLTSTRVNDVITLNVGAGNGITVASDAISVKQGEGITVDANGVHNAGVRTITQDTSDGHKLIINTGGANKTITIPDNDTHYTTGITAGASGTTANGAVSNPYIKIKDDTTHRAQIQLKGGGATTVSSDANGVITINSTDNDTTYTANNGIKLEGTVFKHSNSVASATAQGSSGAIAHGGSISIPKVTYDAYGHITSSGTTSITLPAAPVAMTETEIDAICEGTLNGYLNTIAAEGVAF